MCELNLGHKFLLFFVQLSIQSTIHSQLIGKTFLDHIAAWLM